MRNESWLTCLVLVLAFSAAADGALKLMRKTTDSNTDMVFAYEPGEADTGCAILSGFERTSGNIFRFR